MKLLFNSRDRAHGDWERLFREAYSRFHFQGVRLPGKGSEGIPPQALLSIIEAIWQE